MLKDSTPVKLNDYFLEYVCYKKSMTSYKNRSIVL